MTRGAGLANGAGTGSGEGAFHQSQAPSQAVGDRIGEVGGEAPGKRLENRFHRRFGPFRQLSANLVDQLSGYAFPCGGLREVPRQDRVDRVVAVVADGEGQLEAVFLNWLASTAGCADMTS